MFHRAFTAIELLLVIGILGVLVSLSIPAYRDYQIRSDLNKAAEHITQALARARLLSVSGERDAQWGVHSPSGVLFSGSGFASRDTSLDETFPIPSTIAVSGLQEVAFARLTGRPSATGTIILTALNGAQRRIDILLNTEGISTTTEDELTICHCPAHTPVTLHVPEAAWPAHQAHGDHLGACTGGDDECEEDD